MTLGDIEQTMARLAARRPIFYSEADSQHAFAWQLLGEDLQPPLVAHSPIKATALTPGSMDGTSPPASSQRGSVGRPRTS